MANVQLDRVSKQYPDGTTAVDEVSLEVEDREFLVLVGPSGCGKSTTLRLIAGLEASTAGTVTIGGRDVTNVAPKDRDIAMVFQNYALYPHMSVYKNMSFGLKLRYSSGMLGSGVLARGLSKIFQPRRAAEIDQLADQKAQLFAGIDQQVRQTAARLGIDSLLNRKPHQLSGGERQRVALGRAIVRNPAAFLFDEPLSNLDAKLRQQMRGELKRLHRDLNATMIYVTHDQVEAMTLGDRVAVMNGGKILQVGRPLEIYQRPANLFVARFIGNVPINLCSGTVGSSVDGAIEFTLAADASTLAGAKSAQMKSAQMKSAQMKSAQMSLRWPSDQQTVNWGQLAEFKGNEVTIGFRAEDVTVGSAIDGSADTAALSGNRWRGVVVEVDRLGDASMVHVELTAVGQAGEIEAGEIESVKSRREASGQVILAKCEASSDFEIGEPVWLDIARQRVLWFDPKSGENLLKE